MPKQFAVAGYVVAAAAEPHGLAAGGTVERFCDRRPPVDDHGVAVLVEDGDAADMEMVTLGLVDTPEDQRLIADIQVFEPGSHLVGEDVSFVAGLVGAALARFDIVGDGLSRPRVIGRGARRPYVCRPLRRRSPDVQCHSWRGLP